MLAKDLLKHPARCAWATWCREMMERSTAAQCPSVPYQLAGAKKIQQDLAGSDVVERFVDGPEEASLIRACFAGLPLQLRGTALRIAGILPWQ